MTSTRHYYDEFSHGYEAKRHIGYHRLLDELEVELACRYGKGRILEAGCGTGLILARLAAAGAEVIGVDLSGGMLSHAHRRGLTVIQGRVDALPLANDMMDGVVSFKVLAHVPTLEATLSELARVTRPGGFLVLEFYNRRSLRYLIKRLKTPTRIGSTFTDADVYTRFDTLKTVLAAAPSSLKCEAVHGIRIFTPAAVLHQVPLVHRLLAQLERRALDWPLLARWGGFLVVVFRKIV